MTNTMTTREFYTAIINYLDGQDMDGEAIQQFAVEALSKLDARNEKRKSTDTKEKKEAAARRELVFEFLKGGTSALTRDQIAEGTGLEPSKVTGACSALVKAGLVTKSEVKVDKARKVAYSIA